MYSHNVIIRPRVQALLQQATRAPLTVISATAGYGKTLALRQYIAKSHHTAWVSLTSGDVDVFWQKLCAALYPLSPRCSEALMALGVPQDERQLAHAVESLLQCAASCAREYDTPAHIIIDDFHHMHPSPLIAKLFFDLAYEEPKGLHIILLTRHKPILPLMTLISKGLCSLIRTDALAFTQEEIHAYFTQNDIHLTPEQCRDLHQKTAGWIAALSLLRLDTDASRTFTTLSDIFTLLRTEIIDKLDAREQKMFCQLSIVDSFNLSLARAILDSDHAEDLLGKLVSANAFISTNEMDEYVLHPLLQECLRNECQRKGIALEPCYLRAAHWYRAHHDTRSASICFWMAHAYEELLQQFSHTEKRFLPFSHTDIVQKLATKLPPEVMCKYPTGTILLLTLMVFFGDGETQSHARTILSALRNHINNSDFPNKHHMMGECYLIEFFLLQEYCACSDLLLKAAKLMGGVPTRILRPCDPFTYTLPSILHYEYRIAGELNTTLEHVSNEYFNTFCPNFGRGSSFLAHAEAKLEQYDLDHAKTLARQAAITAKEAEQTHIAAVAHFILARCALAQADITEARRQWETIRAMEPSVRSNSLSPFNRRMFMDLVDLAQGWLLTGTDMPHDLPPSLTRGQDGGPAHGWLMRGMGYPTLIRARAALVRGDLPLLERTAEDFLRNHPTRHQIGRLHCMLFLSIAQHSKNTDKALHFLEKAVQEAEKDTIILPFVEYMQHLRPSLETLSRKGTSPFVQQILAACPATKDVASRPPDNPLTAREIEVLQHTNAGLTRAEIALRCGIREDTVRKHLLAIYRKLHVNNKVMALHAAQRLQIL